MAREIRVTIDDDEVFERMRARKRELDLSWEEVLHRGLRDQGRESADLSDRIERQVRQRVEESMKTAFGIDADSVARGANPRGTSGAGPASSGTGAGSAGTGAGSAGTGAGSAGTAPGSAGTGATGTGPAPGEPGPDPSGFDVEPAGSGREAGDVDPAPDAGSLDAEMESLANAEDAELRFPFLTDEPGNRVPLRVRLETTADGLDVAVVAIRSGKSVADYNAFERTARPAIASRLADGETAILSLADGAEEYHVVPSLSWQATPDGPTVTEAAIREVRVDA